MTSHPNKAEMDGAESQQCGTGKIKFGLVLDEDSLSVDSVDLFCDVVTVHGLHGCSKSTWRNSSRCFFPEKRVRVMNYDYDTSDAMGGVYTRKQFREEAMRLLEGLVKLRNKPDEVQETLRPLIFVAHDLGAIIVKQALNLAGLDLARFGNVSHSPVSMVFFGCPHRCTSSQDLEEKLVRFLLVNRRSPRHSFTRVTEILAESIIEINNAFIDTKTLIKSSIINVFSAAKDPLLQVFDRFTTTLNAPFESSVSIDSSHMELVKILNVDGNAVADRLRRVSYLFGLSASVTQYLPTLLSQASPIYPPKTANDPCHPNSDLNWINDNEIFKNWLAGRNTSILHVHGTSGVSNVGEHIFQHLNSTIDFLSDHSVLYFEFKQHDARFNTMKSMLSTFLAQIISHYTNLEERVVRNFELLVHYRCWTNKDLYAFLEDLRATRKIDGITYVINGLDQCDDSRAWFLAELVSIARYSESRYKVIITSTGSKEIEDILSESRTINLDDHRKTDSPSPDASFSNVGFELALLFQERPEYCAFEVTLGELLSGCDTDLRSLILDWLTFNDHSTTKSAIEERLQKLSPVFLQNVLETIVTSIDLERQAWARRIIAMVSCSFRPLTIWELRATLALDTYPEGRETDPLVFLDILAEFRRHFGSLFAFKSGEIYFGHPFARDFFIPSESYTSQARRWFEFEGQEIAHAEITSFCLNYLSLPEVKKQANEIVAQHISLPQCPVFDSRFDLLSYATRYWPDHYKLAISTNPESESVKLTTQAVTKFFGDTDAVLLWARFHHFLSNPAIRPEKPLSSSLSILSSFGFDGFIAQKILLLDHSVEPGNFSLALVEAARGDHVETLLLLLKRFTPSQPTLQDAIKAAASCSGENSLLVLLEYASGSVEKVEWLPDLLCRAAWLGLENVVTYLVRSGAEPNPPTPFHGMSPLHLAARNKHTSVANVLLKRNASLTCKALSGENVLQTACIYGHPEIVRLVAQAKSDLETEDEAGSVPLHYACRNGHHQVVKVMLEAGADKNRGKKGIQPLITTTKRGYIECCRSLLKYGANVKVKPDDYPPILQLAVDVGSVELVKLFVDHGAEIDEEDGNTTALSCAAQNGSTDIVTYLIQGNADVNRPKEAEFSPVYLAACNGHADILESLVKAGADVNTMSSDDGRGPLHIAYDFPDVARVLLKNGAELNRASSSRPPLLLASRHNYPEVVKVYLQYKPNLEIEHPNGMTALSMATAQGNSEIVRLLLEAGANVNHLTQNKEFPLQYCLAGFNDFKEDILRALLEYSPSLNLVDADGDTALNCLTPETPVSFIRLLINAGADPEICNKSGWTPICMAVIANNIDVVKYLLSKKVRVNIAAENGGPLHLACSIRSFELTKILVDGGADVNFVTSGNIGTPLHSTYDWIFDGEDEVIGGEVNGQNGVNDPIHIDDQEVDEVNGQDKAYNQDTKNDRENLFRINPRERAKKQIIEYLIEAGAGVNVFGGRFGYPLNAACLHGTPDIIKSLLDKRARLDVEDGMGRRPVHLAAYRTLDHFELTLDGATNLSVKDKLERTPLHYAVMSGQVELVRRVLDLSVGLVNEPDCDKWTPILWAARKCGRWVTANDELPEVIELLVSAGADLWVRGEGLNGEWSPLKVARYYGAEGKIVELLTPKSKQRSSDESWEDYFHLSKKAVRRHNVYCDSCLLWCWGTYYKCSTCSDYDLCFKCYRSRDTIHPGHPFQDVGPEYENPSEPSETTTSEAIDEDEPDDFSASADESDFHVNEDKSDSGLEQDEKIHNSVDEDNDETTIKETNRD